MYVQKKIKCTQTNIHSFYKITGLKNGMLMLTRFNIKSYIYSFYTLLMQVNFVKGYI